MKNYYLLIAILFSGLANAQFQIDFDNMNPGNVSPQSPHIVLWPAPGVTDAQVTTEEANSTPHSIVLRENDGVIVDDILVSLGNKTTGIWSVSWMMFVPTGKTGYWNIQQHGNATPAQWNGQFFIGQTASGGSAGVITYDVASATVPYLNDTWFEVEIVVNLDLKKLSIEVEGVALVTNVDYKDTNNNTATQLGAINFYSIDANNRYYVDDFVLVEKCINPVILQTTAPDKICEGETAQLTVASNGERARWFDDETGGNLMHTGFVYVTGPLNQTTSFWVEAQNETGAGDICSSAREEVVVIVIPTPDQPIGNTIQKFDPGETLADLNVTGVNLKWYADDQRNVGLPDTTPLVDNTTYWVNQTVDDCEGDLLGITAVLELSVGKYNLANLDIYPNPASDIIHLKGNQIIDNIILYNILGQRVLSQNGGGLSLEVNVSGLSKGVYLLKVTSEGQMGIYRMIKE